MAGLDVGLTGTATATIVIDDKNDHSPKFTRKEVIPESTAVVAAQY
jgi:cadherin 13 (H-cadherin)